MELFARVVLCRTSSGTRTSLSTEAEEAPTEGAGALGIHEGDLCDADQQRPGRADGAAPEVSKPRDQADP